MKDIDGFNRWFTDEELLESHKKLFKERTLLGKVEDWLYNKFIDLLWFFK